MEIKITSLFGLPAHPLIVHAVVVLLPLAAIGCVLLAIVPRWRRPYGPLVLAAAVVAVISVVLAKGSGEELEHQEPKSELIERHAELADGLLPWTIVLAVAAVGVAVAPRVEARRGDASRAVGAALVVVALVAAGGATYTVAKVGHSGAKAAWHDVGEDDDG